MKELNRAKELIENGNKLRDDFRDYHDYDQSKNDDFLRLKSWNMSCGNFLNRIGLDDFYAEFLKIDHGPGDFHYRISEQLGILESAKYEIESGFVNDIKFLLHADMFDSITDQAEELLTKGHEIPSAVLCRIVIEEWLRDEADKNAISSTESLKASGVNDLLKKNDILSTPRWRQIQSHLDTGNSAAHGKTDEFETKDIEAMIQCIRNFCV
ncbi:hypothetical protein KKH43_05480 [Patescibacteria group bacterium]|nr:hypothetical protein [Patescibacteria group bacterium]